MTTDSETEFNQVNQPLIKEEKPKVKDPRLWNEPVVRLRADYQAKLSQVAEARQQMTTMPSGELNKFLQTLGIDCAKKPPKFFKDKQAEIDELDQLLQDIIRSKEHTRSLPAVAQVLKNLADRRLKSLEAQSLYNRHINAIFSAKEVDLNVQRL